jgi:hypothetical protein
MRRIVSITGSRADYGLMEPIYRAIAGNPAFDLHLVITGMHQYFNCVVDIACLMCNDPDSPRRILGGVLDRLKTRGEIFSMSGTPDCWGATSGTKIADATYRDLTDGSLANTGTVRFSPEEKIRDLYSGFNDLTIGMSSYSIGDKSRRVSHWIFEGNKG